MSIVTTNPLSYGLAALRYGSSSTRRLPRAVPFTVTEGQKSYVRSLNPPDFARLYLSHGVLSGRNPEGGAGPARTVHAGATALAGTERVDTPYRFWQVTSGRPLSRAMLWQGHRSSPFGPLRRAIKAYQSQDRDVELGRLVNIRHGVTAGGLQKVSRMRSAGLGRAVGLGASSTVLTMVGEGGYVWLKRPHRGSWLRGSWAHMKRSKVTA